MLCIAILVDVAVLNISGNSVLHDTRREVGPYQPLTMLWWMLDSVYGRADDDINCLGLILD